MVNNVIPHWIQGKEQESDDKGTFETKSPCSGEIASTVARGTERDVESAVNAAHSAFTSWTNTAVITRADKIRDLAILMSTHRSELASIIAEETGKAPKEALGEVGAAIEQAYFIAGEGRRLYGRTTNSAVPHRTAKTIRQAIGVCALIIPANTPIANIAWKSFPALVCGNTVVLKPPEDCPRLAHRFAQMTKEVGFPDGVFNVVHGLGTEAGRALVEHPKVDLVSFTGSVAAGRAINQAASGRLARVILELGGKNALVVCDDADIDEAVKSSGLSAFSNAGQRCASGSRLVVFETVYEEFREKLLAYAADQKVGPTDSDDYGPVINERQFTNILGVIERERAQNPSNILCGGTRVGHQGYYIAPTVIEGVSSDSELAQTELFGPVTCLFKVKNFEQAVELVNDSEFKLTASIHTRNLHRAERFQKEVRTGVVSVNGPTYGSEPHLPFGGLGVSGNGWREAGSEALDAYSEWKTIYVVHNPSLV